MSLATIRAKYKEILLRVPNRGVVYDYRRSTGGDWKKFIDLFVDPSLVAGGATRGKIRGWEIGCEASAAERVHLSGVNDRRHDMKIRGYFGLSDAAASEKESDLIVEAVCDEFRPLVNLEGAALRVFTPLLVTLSDHREFGGVLCHYVELSQSVEERIVF